MRQRLLILTLCSVLLSTSYAGVGILRSAADWDRSVVERYGDTLPVISEQWLPDEDRFAWNAYQWVQGYLSMAQLTGDAKYMEDSREILNYMLSLRDDIRFAESALTGEYYYAPTQYLFNAGQPAQGWRRKFNNSYAVSVLIDGRICELFLRWSQLARQSFPQFDDDVARYVARVGETIAMHQPAFREIPAEVDVAQGSYTADLRAGGFQHWWHSHPPVEELDGPEPRVFSSQLPINHTMTMVAAMRAYDEICGTELYRERVQLSVNFYLNCLDRNYPDAAIWQYDPIRRERTDVEDIGHAAISLPLLQGAALDGGFGVGPELMRRLANTYTLCFDSETGAAHRYIDGTDLEGERQWETYGMRAATCFYDWLWLSQYDPSILGLARNALSEAFSDEALSGLIMGGWANLLYWEHARDGDVVIKDMAPL